MTNWILWGTLLVLSALAWGLARLALRRQRLLRNGLQAQGTVVALHKRSHAEDGVSYFAEIAFTDKEGVPHQFECEEGSRFARPAVGTTVSVRYDPLKQNSAMLDTLEQGWWPTLLIWVVIFFLAVCVLGIIGELKTSYN